MAKRTAAPTGQARAATRNHQGRVYMSCSMTEPLCYAARIWRGDGTGQAWSAKLMTPEAAFDAMRAHAVTMSVPVDLWRHGHRFVETVGRAAA